jgi:DNA-directed RNA polymerase specialized sigma24 family protein
MTRRDEFKCNLTNYEDGALQQEYRELVQDEIDNLPERYKKAAADSSAKALWDKIGEDLGSPSEDRSMNAFAIAVEQLAKLGGHLYDMVDERETHDEGWREERGKDQHFANEGMEYISQIYTDLDNSKKHSAVALDFFRSLNLPQRYYSTALAHGFSQPWYDLIDKDFSNPSEGVRKDAWVAFNFSYISKYEEKMNREGIQDVYVRCYEKLVKEGAFTSSGRKHYIARVYFNVALDNARINKHTRHPDPFPFSDLSDEELEAASNNLSTESAEEEAWRDINAAILSEELGKRGYLAGQEYRFFKAIFVDDWTIEELAKHYGKKPGAIREALSQVRRKNILRRDICIATEIQRWAGLWYNDCTYFNGHIDFSGHADWLIEEVKEAMKPTLKMIETLDPSAPFLLPLTSGIAQRPGRLYLYTNPVRPYPDFDRLVLPLEERLFACLQANHIVNPGHNYLAALSLGSKWNSLRDPDGLCSRNKQWLLPSTGFPMLDEVISQLRGHLCEHNGGRLEWAIGMLFSEAEPHTAIERMGAGIHFDRFHLSVHLQDLDSLILYLKMMEDMDSERSNLVSPESILSHAVDLSKPGCDFVEIAEHHDISTIPYIPRFPDVQRSEEFP